MEGPLSKWKCEEEQTFTHHWRDRGTPLSKWKNVRRGWATHAVVEMEGPLSEWNSVIGSSDTNTTHRYRNGTFEREAGILHTVVEMEGPLSKWNVSGSSLARYCTPIDHYRSGKVEQQ